MLWRGNWDFIVYVENLFSSSVLLQSTCVLACDSIRKTIQRQPRISDYVNQNIRSVCVCDQLVFENTERSIRRYFETSLIFPKRK